jgi:hypothetical protein
MKKPSITTFLIGALTGAAIASVIAAVLPVETHPAAKHSLPPPAATPVLRHFPDADDHLAQAAQTLGFDPKADTGLLTKILLPSAVAMELRHHHGKPGHRCVILGKALDLSWKVDEHHGYAVRFHVIEPQPSPDAVDGRDDRRCPEQGVTWMDRDGFAAFTDHLADAIEEVNSANRLEQTAPSLEPKND